MKLDFEKDFKLHMIAYQFKGFLDYIDSIMNTSELDNILIKFEDIILKYEMKFIENFSSLLENWDYDDIVEFFRGYHITNENTRMIIQRISNSVSRNIKNKRSEYLGFHKSENKLSLDIYKHKEFQELFDQMLKINTNKNPDKNEDFDTLLFTLKFMIYKQHENLNAYSKLNKINKAQLYDIYNRKVPSSQISRSTFYERIRNLIPSSPNEKGKSNNAEPLNIFQVTAISGDFILREKQNNYYKSLLKLYKASNSKLGPKTKLSNLNIHDITSAQKILRDQLKKTIFNDFEKELFIETCIQDTFHFTVFSAINSLITEVTNKCENILSEVTNIDSLVAVHLINQIKKNILTELSKQTNIFNEYIIFMNDIIQDENFKLSLKNISPRSSLYNKICEDLLLEVRRFDISSHPSTDLTKQTLFLLIEKFYEQRFKNNEKLLL